MRLQSPAFDHEGRIPAKYTCEGANISPPLTIFEVPRGTRSLVLTMDDPDVPRHIRADGMWDHWVVYNIDPGTRELAEGEEPGGEHGMGTAGNRGYYGPCPPDREHRYYFNLYAVDRRLALGEGATKAEVLGAMEGHVIARATCMGRYEKASR